MLLDIHTDLLRVLVDAQESCHLQSKEGNPRERSGPKDDHDDQDALRTDRGAANAGLASRVRIAHWHAAKAGPAVVVVNALAPIEETGCQHAPDATEAVHRTGVHRIVNLQLLQQHGRGLVHQGTNQADGKGTAALHIALLQESWSLWGS